MVRWGSLVGVAALPFTFGSGLARIPLLLAAAAIAALWLMSLLIAWRTRRQRWALVSVAVLLICPHLFGLNRPEVAPSHGYQVLALVFVLAGAPLLFFPRFFLQFARLDAKNGVAEP